MDREKRFPFDCKGCKYFKARDMSVDDYVLRCEKLNEEVDECDAWMYTHVKCPIEGNAEEFDEDTDDWETKYTIAMGR